MLVLTSGVRHQTENQGTLQNVIKLNYSVEFGQDRHISNTRIKYIRRNLFNQLCVSKHSILENANT